MMNVSSSTAINFVASSAGWIAGRASARLAAVMFFGSLIWLAGFAPFPAAFSTASAADSPDTNAVAKLPALSREWRGVDYQAVAAAIGKGKIPLPRFSDEPGAMLLKKITSVENLAFAQSKSLPIESRLQEIIALVPAANSIMSAYVVPANQGEKVNAELAALLSFMLHAASAQAGILEEYLPRIPHDDKYAKRMEGAKLVRSGLTNMFSGAETSLSERPFYSPDDISLLLQAMADTLPSVRNLLASDFRLELCGKLTAHRKRATRSNDIRNLDRMLAELEV
jgi:hypothetical protein